MKNSIQQVLFTKNNLSKYYLSPYCSIIESDDGIIISREDQNRYYLFNPSSIAELTSLLNYLKEGIEEVDLVNFLENNLKEENAFGWIQNCIQGGIIE